MDSDAASLMTIYKFPTGRRLWALREIARLALAFAASEIAEHAAAGVEHDTEVAAMEARAEDLSRSRYGRDAIAIDRRVDDVLVGTEAHLVARERVYGVRSERGADAALVREKLLPQGAGAITKKAFVPEHERIKALIARARAADLAPIVARIPELPEMIAELETLNTEYGTVLGAYDRDRPAPDDLLAAQARGQEILAEVTAMIVARYARQPARRAEREALLEPILRQQEDIRLARQRRRRPRDIDPDTGVEIPEPDLPDVEPIPGDDPGADPVASA
jgi:hypothetical protein